MDGNFANNSIRSPRRRMTWIWVGLGFLILAVIALSAHRYLGDKFANKFQVKSEYQAVFLTNGQVYFGKLDLSRNWVVLRDIYYLQVSEDLQPASSNEPNKTPVTSGQTNQQQKINLVKLGSELHGPEDEMFIAKDKILFWENMKDSSKVLESIRSAK